jgi:hypothetical protein
MAFSKTERVLAVFELGLAAFLTVLCAMEFKVAFFPSKDTHWESPGWAAIGLIILAPLAVSFAIAGWTLFQRMKNKLLYQLFPFATMIGVFVLFWWADRGYRFFQ